MRFFMVAVLPILPLVPENLLSEKLLPMMFKCVPILASLGVCKR
jgi:hypothetical protein